LTADAHRAFRVHETVRAFSRTNLGGDKLAHSAIPEQSSDSRVLIQFGCGPRILRVIHVRDAPCYLSELNQYGL